MQNLTLDARSRDRGRLRTTHLPHADHDAVTIAGINWQVLHLHDRDPAGPAELRHAFVHASHAGGLSCFAGRELKRGAGAGARAGGGSGSGTAVAGAGQRRREAGAGPGAGQRPRSGAQGSAVAAHMPLGQASVAIDRRGGMRGRVDQRAWGPRSDGDTPRGWVRLDPLAWSESREGPRRTEQGGPHGPSGAGQERLVAHLVMAIAKCGGFGRSLRPAGRRHPLLSAHHAAGDIGPSMQNLASRTPHRRRERLFTSGMHKLSHAGKPTPNARFCRCKGHAPAFLMPLGQGSAATDRRLS
jgi:hypothetical protein